MPELTPNSEARQIAALAAWCLYEESFMGMLVEAGCNYKEIALCMNTAEAS
jgi:hypothetical protein